MLDYFLVLIVQNQDSKVLQGVLAVYLSGVRHFSTVSLEDVQETPANFAELLLIYWQHQLM